MGDNKADVTFGAPPDGVSPVESAGTQGVSKASAYLKDAGTVTFGAPPAGTNVVAAANDSDATNNNDHQNEQPSTWQKLNTGLISPQTMSDAFAGRGTMDEVQKAQAAAQAQPGPSFLGVHAGPVGPTTLADAQYAQEHPALNYLKQFFHYATQDAKAVPVGASEGMSSLTSPLQLGMMLLSGGTSAAFRGAAQAQNAVRAAEAFNALKLTAQTEGVAKAAQLLVDTSNGKMTLQMATQIAQAAEKANKFADVAEIMAKAQKMAKVANVAGKGGQVLNAGLGATAVGQGVSQTLSGVMGQTDAQGNQIANPSQRGSDVIQGVANTLMGGHAMGEAAGTARQMLRDYVSNNIHATSEKVAGQPITRRNPNAPKLATALSSPEQLEAQRSQVTGPQVQQAIGNIARGSTGATGPTTPTAEDLSGLTAHADELLQNFKSNVNGKLDKWAEGRSTTTSKQVPSGVLDNQGNPVMKTETESVPEKTFSDWQEQEDNYRRDFTTDGRAKYNEAIENEERLVKTYNEENPNDKIDWDAEKRNYRHQVALRDMDQALRPALNMPTEGNPTQPVVRSGDSLNQAVKRILAPNKRTGQSIADRLDFTQQDKTNLQKLGAIMATESNMPKLNLLNRWAVRLALGGVTHGLGAPALEMLAEHGAGQMLGKALTSPQATRTVLDGILNTKNPQAVAEKMLSDINSTDPTWKERFGDQLFNVLSRINVMKPFAAPGTTIKEGEQGLRPTQDEATREYTDVGNGVHQVVTKNAEGDSQGQLLAKDVEGNPQATRVASHWVANDARGKGYGSAQIEHLAQELANQGKTTLLSDLEMTDSAKRAWDRLQSKYPDKVKKTASGYIFDLSGMGQDEDLLSKGAAEYSRRHGLGTPDTTKVPKDARGAEIADAYDKMAHDPNDPRVAGSYEALKDEVKQQYNYATQKLGIKIVPTDTDPYKSYQEMRDDVRKNHQLKVWRNTVGEDTRGGNPLPTDHPMSEVDPDTGENYGTLFRAVHDLFGHAAEDNDFSEQGEENAWNMHRQMFSDKAVPAMTSETKGQTSWFYNHQGVRNGEPLGKFAEQKAGLLPQEHTGGSVGQKLVEKYGTTDDPTKAAFILHDGTMVPLGANEHDRMLGQVSKGITREDFIDDENAVRTRVRKTSGGKEVVFSVPKNVTPEQVAQMQFAVQKMGSPNIFIETTNPARDGYYKAEGANADNVQEGVDKVTKAKPARTAPETGAGPQTMAQRAREILDARTAEQRWTPENIMDTVRSGGRYAILQAENPQNRRVSDAYNKFLTDQLKKDLESQGYAAIPVTGNTKDVAGVQEHAFFVPGIPADEAAAMGRKYNQMGIFHGQKGLIDLNSGTATPPDTKGIKFDDEARAQQYYTTVGGRDFSIPTLDQYARPENATPGERVATRRPARTVNGETVYQPHNPNRAVGMNDILNANNVANFAEKATEGVPSMTFEPQGDITFGDEEPEELTPHEKIQSYVQQAKDHIKAMFNAVPDYIKDAAKNWYESAHNMTKAWAQQYGLKHEQTAAVTAVTSPQNPWQHNTYNAKRIIDLYHTAQNEPWDQGMSHEAASQAKRAMSQAKKAKSPAAVASFLQALEDIHFKKLGDLETPYQKGLWIMLHDLANGPKTVDLFDPRGNHVGLSRTVDGEPEEPMWFMEPLTLAKAVSIIEDGSMRNIDAQLGNGHKVRSFYNNIIDPWSPQGDVTVDTHAVGGATFSPMGSKDAPVKSNFGRVTSKPNGLYGTYPLNAEAYRQATAELNQENGGNLRPNQVQSVVWEGVKSLFKDKGPEIRDAASRIWKDYQNGEIDAATARARIIKEVGGFESPQWANQAANRPDSGVHAEEGNPRNSGALPSPGVPPAGTEPRGGGGTASPVPEGRRAAERASRVSRPAPKTQALFKNPDALNNLDQFKPDNFGVGTAILVAPDGTVHTDPHYDPANEQYTHESHFNNMLNTGKGLDKYWDTDPDSSRWDQLGNVDWEGFMKDGGVRAAVEHADSKRSKGQDHAWANIEVKDPQVVKRALEILDKSGKDNVTFEYRDPDAKWDTATNRYDTSQNFYVSGTLDHVRTEVEKWQRGRTAGHAPGFDPRFLGGQE